MNSQTYCEIRKLCGVTTISELWMQLRLRVIPGLTVESFLINTVQSVISQCYLIPLAIPNTGTKLFGLDLVKIDLFVTHCQIRTIICQNKYHRVF